jgi:dTDP-4-amino-4,6-dideoxygalactose transaminase
VNVPFLDLKWQYEELRSQIDHAIGRVLESGCYIGGPEVEAFESEFAEYCSCTHVVGVANGLDAIHLALRALEVGAGDEVIVPSNTFIATWLAVTQCGATPVPVEPDVRTFNIDPLKIEEKITDKTKAIIAVHLYGQPSSLDEILKIGKKYNIRILEDAAQAHGARYKGKRIGAHGDVVTWSFYPGKNLGAMGDGGAISTNCSDTAEKIKVLRNYGSSIKYVHEKIGYNSRLDPVQAAVLRVKLRFLDEWNAKRKEVADKYLSGLSERNFLLPTVPEWADPVWHLFVIQCKDRTLLQQKLSSKGVQTLIHYPTPPHMQGAYKAQYLGGSEAFPVAEELAESVLSLPIGPHLSDDQVLHVINTLERFAD